MRMRVYIYNYNISIVWWNKSYRFFILTQTTLQTEQHNYIQKYVLLFVLKVIKSRQCLLTV